MKHDRVTYLFRYLCELKTKTIVVEYEYTDAAYLDDYSRYYSRSFRRYERRCRRLHFFSLEFDRAQFLSWITNPTPVSALSEHYLGFVVVRPLPEAIIGRTALATYPADDGRRHYPVAHECSANLFGTCLTVRSLPFQEQDTVLAACATVALWSAFQECARQFGTVAPSPAEITAAATTTDVRGRALPSRGLTLSQMTRAVQTVGLEPEVYTCSASLPLNSLIYSYVAAGLPVILVMEVNGQGHAVTIAGYSLRSSRCIDREDMAPASPPIRRIGLRIDEWYGHDDQVGPFARMKIRADPPPADGKGGILNLTGSWPTADRSAHLTLLPRHVIVPVYHKIRVTFLDIQQWLASFNRLAAQVTTNFQEFEWDLRLTTANDFKLEMRRAAPQQQRERFLLASYPRFLWRATLQTYGQKRVELLFDATDMARSYPFQDALFYDNNLAVKIGTIVRAPDLQNVLSELITPQLLVFLKDQTSAYQATEGAA